MTTKTELLDLIRYARLNLRRIEEEVRKAGPLSDLDDSVLSFATEGAGAAGTIETLFEDLFSEVGR